MKPEDVKFALSVSHCPWIGGRAKSMENLRHALGIEGESCVGADAYHEERERAPWWWWSESMWRWAASQDHTTHAVLLQDDAIATPHAWPILSAMVAARPTDVISLHCLHPAAMTLAREGVRWASTCDGLVGLGYVFPRQALVDFLAWRPKNLRPGGAQELAEDSHINIWAISTGRRILHPLPTVLDHDTSVGSTNQAQTCGSPRVLLVRRRRRRMGAGRSGARRVLDGQGAASRTHVREDTLGREDGRPELRSLLRGRERRVSAGVQSVLPV